MDWARVVRRTRVPLGLVFALAYLILARPTWNSLLVSVPVVVLGLVVRSYASGYVSKNKSLATSGPYAYTRNPLYLGSILITAGFALAGLPWPWAIVLAVAFFASYLPTILSEERFLRGRFPEYEAYARAVPRLLPRPTPARLGGERGGFSRALYLKHREYRAWIGATAVYGVLVANKLLNGSF